MIGEGSHGPITVVGLDGDDTLWHSERHFQSAQLAYRAIVARSAAIDPDELDGRLLEVERANLSLFGYGVKAFTLSLVETAVEVTQGAISARDLAEVLEIGKELLRAPLELLDGAAEAVEALAGRARLVLVTKGDLLHQELKAARSGLIDAFDSLQIVSEKDEATYRTVLARVGARPEGFVMVGNSVASDVLPVLAVGARAVHVPHELIWPLDHADADADVAGFEVLASLAELPPLIEAMGLAP